MDSRIDVVGDVAQAVSTGALPGWDQVEELVVAAHARYADDSSGVLADYIPVLAQADPAAFGVCVVDADGREHAAGATTTRFSIQSISKAFVYALVSERLGHAHLRERIGVDNTGLAFNSVMAVELHGGHPRNPMVNAGAIATTALVEGDGPDEQWEAVVDGLSRFAGRRLEVDEVVYTSEAATNSRNKAIARLLESYGRIEADPLDVVDVYTRQCSLLVDAHDLAVMGATLADGGVNPVTGERVVSEQVATDTLAVLASTGMYERSGEWLFDVGLPAKSGVAGGIVAVSPGKGAIGTYSPLLDPAGNSVRGQRATAYLSRALGLNVFASSVHVPTRPTSPEEPA
ncbi:glutaminase A [Cellulomonas sp. HZM]|uniref:glutaminase A n=1 Tax=Cellulomonas sp. HZM TaxID=1454010 RepID=UPI000552759D|nr:glutaminase A [Cellulomonas sp. HZM]